MVEGGSAGVLEETGTAGVQQKGQRQQGRRRGATEGRCRDAKKEKGALDGNGKQQRTGWEGTVGSEGREGGVEKGTGAQREGGATDPSTTEDGGLATWETGTSIEKRPTASDNHRDIMEKRSGGVTSS